MKDETILSYARPIAEPAQSLGREIFGVVVRVTGFLLILYGLLILVLGIFGLFGLEFLPWELNYVWYVHLISGVIYLAAGIPLFKGGWVVRLAYGQQK